ncbi:MAG TPA: hypothetical protein PLD25_18045 [Chloroflexota bacterium]|nr:hypothetical protein [Chloroflexota bacterium]
MNAPFAFLPPPRRNRWMKIAIVLALGMTLFFNLTGGPLQTAVAPAGILSFEFAGNVMRSQAMIASWGEHGRLVAAFGLGLDFLYPLVYASAISLACVWAAERVQPKSPAAAKWGIWLAWGVWLAALLDYVENVALVLLLFGSTAVLLPPLAFICAAIKFGLILAGIFYVLIAWLLFR